MDRPRHLVSAADVDRCLLDDLFALARAMEEVVHSRGSTDDLRGRVLATLFYEPSTRTRFSFEVAMMRLGGGVVGAENAREHSSGAKGETLEDTTRIVGSYADGIVVRHYEEGAAARMAAVLSCALPGIVGSAETAPAESRISPECPVGRALLRHHAGDVVHVQTPDGRDVLRSEGITPA